MRNLDTDHDVGEVRAHAVREQSAATHETSEWLHHSTMARSAEVAGGPMFETRVRDDECVVIAAGELDMASEETFRAVLERLTGIVVIDLSAVTFLDSSAMGVMVVQQKRLRAAHGELRVSKPSEFTRQVLVLTGLGEWIVD